MTVENTNRINEIENDNFIWMTPNIALADNTFSRMKDFRQTSIYNEVKRKEDKSKTHPNLEKSNGMHEFIEIRH